MFKLLSDENFNADIVRGLLLRNPDLDMVRVQDIDLAGAEDPVVLAWAAENGRIVLTHDRATLPDYAYERLIASTMMPGVFVVHDRLSVGQAIQELALVLTCSEASEWVDRVLYLPL